MAGAGRRTFGDSPMTAGSRRTARVRAGSPSRNGTRNGNGGTAQDPLADSIYAHPGFLIRRMQQIAVAIFLEETARFDLTPLQYGLLMAVHAHPGIDQAGAADRLGLDRTTVVGIVDRLERKGLLVREVGAADRRLRLLHLAAPGKHRLADCQRAVDRAQRRMLEPLSAQDRRTLARSMARVIAHHNDGTRVPLTDAALRSAAP